MLRVDRLTSPTSRISGVQLVEITPPEDRGFFTIHGPHSSGFIGARNRVLHIGAPYDFTGTGEITVVWEKGARRESVIVYHGDGPKSWVDGREPKTMRVRIWDRGNWLGVSYTYLLTADAYDAALKATGSFFSRTYRGTVEDFERQFVPIYRW